MTISMVPSARPSRGRLGLGRRDQPRQPPDLQWKAVQPLDEIAVMLPRQQRRRAHQRDLPAGHRHDEGGAKRDLGLAETDVAAHQPVHRPAAFEVGENVGDRAVLVVGFLIRKAVDEGGVGGVGFGDHAGPRRAHRRDLDQLTRDRADALLHLRLAPLPGFAAEAVERDVVALAAVAGQKLDILDRHVQLVAARIFERDAVVRIAADGDLGQPVVAADAMVGVYDEVAGRERRQLLEERGGGLALAPPPDEPVAEHVLLGEHRDVRRGEAMVERQHEHRRLGFGGKRGVPAVDQLVRLEVMVLEQTALAVRERPWCSLPGRPCGPSGGASLHGRRPLRRHWPAARARARNPAPARPRNRSSARTRPRGMMKRGGPGCSATASSHSSLVR